jgi:hypothetical protein
MELWQGLTSATRNRHIARISKDGTVAKIRYSRGAREAIATVVGGGHMWPREEIIKSSKSKLVYVDRSQHT